MDLLDLRANRFTSETIDDVAHASPDLPIDLYAVRRSALRAREGASSRPSDEGWVLTFGKLLSETPFVPYLREMLGILRDAYEYPVDIEFTANFLPDGRCLVNLVQCRPLQVKEGETSSTRRSGSPGAPSCSSRAGRSSGKAPCRASTA